MTTLVNIQKKAIDHVALSRDGRQAKVFYTDGSLSESRRMTIERAGRFCQRYCDWFINSQLARVI